MIHFMLWRRLILVSTAVISRRLLRSCQMTGIPAGPCEIFISHHIVLSLLRSYLGSAWMGLHGDIAVPSITFNSPYQSPSTLTGPIPSRRTLWRREPSSLTIAALRTQACADYEEKVTFRGQHLQVQQSHRQTNTGTDSKRTHAHTHPPWLQPPQRRHSEKHQTDRSVSLFGRVQVQTCLLQSAHFNTLTLVYHSDRAVNTSRAQRSNTRELSRWEGDNLMRGKVLRHWAFLEIYPLEIKMEQFDTRVKYLMSIKKMSWCD